MKFLENYPFKNIGVEVIAGFADCGGIDFALGKDGNYASFEVYSMYEGDFRFGVSDVLGKYFMVSKTIGESRYDTIYARLDHVNEDLQKYAIIRGDKDFVVPAKYFLGWSSTAGNKQGSRFLHIEFHEKNLVTGERKKFDPYGIYDRANCSKYPQPGSSLAGLDHAWVGDSPEFITG